MRAPLVFALALYLVAHGVNLGSAQTTNVSGSASLRSTPAQVGYGVASVTPGAE